MENKFIDKMKQLSEIEEIEQEAKVNITHQLRYPTKEDIENLKNGDGVYSLGAQTTYAPMPTDEEVYGQHYNNVQNISNDDMLAGLDDEYSVKRGVTEKPAEKDTFASKKQKPQEKQEQKSYDANAILIENAKKQDVDLMLTFKAKIPVSAFFEAMDTTYVKKNQNALLSEIINSLKMNELDKQLKEKLKEFYGLK